MAIGPGIADNRDRTWQPNSDPASVSLPATYVHIALGTDRIIGNMPDPLALEALLPLQIQLSTILEHPFPTVMPFHAVLR